jgi:molybdopterin-binding protein
LFEVPILTLASHLSFLPGVASLPQAADAEARHSSNGCQERLAYAKNSSVMGKITLAGGASMKLSARNILKGKVKKVIHGAVNSEVTVALAGGAELVSIITKQSAKNLKLAKGKSVYAVVKASNVILGVD